MEIILKNLQKKIPIPKAKVIRAVKGVVSKLEKNRDSHHFLKKNGGCPYFSIVFVGAKRMRGINKKYLKHDYVTDVLTFDLGEGISEIIICPRVAVAQAQAHQTSTDKEIILYVIHGILHLAGYDDHNEKDTLQMRKMETKLLE